jgi:hypothetical protein
MEIKQLSSTDIENLLEILSFNEDKFSKTDLNSILNTINASKNSIDLGLYLGFLIKNEDMYLIDRSSLFYSLDEDVQRRRAIILQFSKLNSIFFSEVYRCTPRKLASSDGSKRVAQLLSNAKLTIPLDESGERWWLEFRWYLRQMTQEDPTKLGNIGDEGEKLSMAYEKRRLDNIEGIQRISVIDGDLAGYDILSFTDIETQNLKRIEVKASLQDLDSARIYLTWNEFKVSQQHGEHEFHLWPNVENPNDEPYVVSVDNMSQFVPEVHNQVQWETFSIPMKLLID